MLQITTILHKNLNILLIKILILIFAIDYLAIALIPTDIYAAPVYDQTNGTYLDDFSDSTGLYTKYHCNVNTSTKVLQLTKNDGSGAFTAPYYTSAYTYTKTITPTSIAAWGSVTFNANTPVGTAINIQIYDSRRAVLMSDTVLTGNSTGFTSSPIDISSLPPWQVITSEYSSGRIGQLAIKITLTTSNTSVTPTLDDLRISWTVKQGDLSASAFNTDGWGNSWFDQEGTSRSNYSNTQTYAAFRWASDKVTGFSSANKLFIYNNQLISSYWYPETTTIPYGSDRLRSYNLDNGTSNWQLPFQGLGRFVISQNGTGYETEETNDIFVAVDLNTGTPKWSYSFGSGHGTDITIIGKDGTIYTVVQQNLLPGSISKTATVYAFNPDGSVKWTKDITITDENYIFTNGLSYDASRDTLYLSTGLSDENQDPLDGGWLYAIDTNTHEVKWENEVGYTTWGAPPLVGGDGTIYVDTSPLNLPVTKKIIAVNPDGTTKWSKSYAEDSDQGYFKMSLRSDNILMVELLQSLDEVTMNYTSTLQAINTNDGSLISSTPMDNLEIAFIDSKDNIYLALTEDGASANDQFAALGYYDKNNNNIWKVLWPYVNVDGSNYVDYHFASEYATWYPDLIGDSRGWLYGALNKRVCDGNTEWDWTCSATDEFIQYFAMAPWQNTINQPAGVNKAGDTISFNITSTMPETNPLLGEKNKMQVVMDNGAIVALSYVSTNSNGDTVWTGSYVLPSETTPGSHNFTVEASQSYMQTNTTTHFAQAATGSNNTGLQTTGSYDIAADILILPETGANY